MLTSIKLVSAALATASGVIAAEIAMTYPAAGWIFVGLAALLWTAAMYRLIITEKE